MNKFVIREGEVWAGNMFRRHWHRVSGLATGNEFGWRISLDMSDVPTGTTIKLCGISTASPFRFQRVKNGGWGQLSSFTHEDSDRIIATAKGNGEIQLKSYAYRNGKGPATSGRGFSDPICRIRNGRPFQVHIRHLDDKTEYVVKDLVTDVYTAEAKRYRSQGFLKHRTFAHAKGYKQPNAPGNIPIFAEVL